MTLVRATSMLAALALLGGCVAGPAGPGYYRPNGYWEPGYYYGPPVYVGPDIDLNFHHDGGWDHDERRHGH